MANLRNGLRNHELLKSELLSRFTELREDEQALEDTLEGISNFPEMIASVLRSAIEDDVYVGAVRVQIEKLQRRAQRLDDRSKRKRALALQYAQEGGLKKVQAPDMTASIVTPAKGSVVIPDESKVPDVFCRIKKVPDRTAIGTAIDEGDVDWAYRNNPQPHWTIVDR